MQIFKFGGASVKNAANIRNTASIISSYQTSDLLVVVSAINKTTNKLEELTSTYYRQEDDPSQLLYVLKDDHIQILKDLFPDTNHPIYDDISNCFVEIEW
ncbi:MAG TPA: aspartate kinase, partial [Sphingobacterium sp.]|nr:aspartate kinase [Sphingobacterium sp.]